LLHHMDSNKVETYKFRTPGCPALSLLRQMFPSG
jgi:hypothetical protein